MRNRGGFGAALLAGVLALTAHAANLTGALTSRGAPIASRPGEEAGSWPVTGTGSTSWFSGGNGTSDQGGETGSGTGRGTRHLRVVLRDVHGDRVGQVEIRALPGGGNEVSVLAWKLTPGFHGFHLHAVGVCDPGGAKPFSSAGGHFNPTGSPEGMQAGAFPVLLAGADGRAQATFVDSNFTLSQLAGPKGAAIVVHAGSDNYANIPTRYTAGGVAGPDMETRMTGDGGARVACGVAFPERSGSTPGSTPAPSNSPAGSASAGTSTPSGSPGGTGSSTKPSGSADVPYHDPSTWVWPTTRK